MTLFALTLVLTAAFCHATWNYLAKKASGGTAFIWLFGSISSLVYFPVALWIIWIEQPEIGPMQLLFMIGSAILHALYFILLDKGYQVGDLSVIYPLARGTGPLLSTITAIFFLGETPSAAAIAGAICIGLGIIIITGNPAKMTASDARKPMLFALLCGTAIAGYTVWDKIAVSSFLIPPILLDWTANLGRALLLTPYAFHNRDKVLEQWRLHKKEASTVAVLCPLAYILVLTAMVTSPVSYIAPAREISILIGSFMGAKLLLEGSTRIRLAGSAAMVSGMVMLALG